MVCSQHIRRGLSWAVLPAHISCSRRPGEASRVSLLEGRKGWAQRLESTDGAWELPWHLRALAATERKSLGALGQGPLEQGIWAAPEAATFCPAGPPTASSALAQASRRSQSTCCGPDHAGDGTSLCSCPSACPGDTESRQVQGSSRPVNQEQTVLLREHGERGWRLQAGTLRVWAPGSASSFPQGWAEMQSPGLSWTC